MRLLRCTLVFALVLVSARAAHSQVRERPVPFDSAGRVNVVTPPLAARLGLAAPLWPVTGDYVETRLYETGDPARPFVLVAQRPQGIFERFTLDSTARRELATAIARGGELSRARSGPDTVPTFVSEPVRGAFVRNQTVLGLTLFGTSAAMLAGNPAASTAAYLLVSGASFFISANMTKTRSVSRAQNHLSSHSALRGAIAASLATYAVSGNDASSEAYGLTTLVGGIAGDIIGFRIASPMTDAEAHGTSHGSTIAAFLATGVFGSAGMYDREGPARTASALIIGAGAVGYPLGLGYVRRAPYRVTAGDIGAMSAGELLGVAAAATLVADDNVDGKVVGLALTAGYALGVFVGDRVFVRPFDHTESEAGLLLFGTGAGALMGIAIPVLADTDNGRALMAATTIGGLLGAIVTERLIEPARATSRRSSFVPARGADRGHASRVDVRFSPLGAISAALGQRGHHSLLNVTF